MKYQRIQQQLLSEILTGAYQNDADFPSENALTRRFGVSRMTARRALDELSKAGYITRIPGKGTMLNKPVFGQGFFAVKPFHEYALERGARASTNPGNIPSGRAKPIPGSREYKQSGRSARKTH